MGSAGRKRGRFVVLSGGESGIIFLLGGGHYSILQEKNRLQGRLNIFDRGEDQLGGGFFFPRCSTNLCTKKEHNTGVGSGTSRHHRRTNLKCVQEADHFSLRPLGGGEVSDQGERKGGWGKKGGPSHLKEGPKAFLNSLGKRKWWCLSSGEGKKEI